VGVEGQEVHIDGLLVLQDEDQDHDQAEDANAKRGPCPAQPGLPLARERW
jgi:hypothetical protein